MHNGSCRLHVPASQEGRDCNKRLSDIMCGENGCRFYNNQHDVNHLCFRALHWVTIQMLCVSMDEEILEVSENVVKAITGL